MKIKDIQLSNYRNFENYTLELGDETTILIGKNGMGKTNLITAIKQSLSFIFSRKKGEIQFDFIASSDQKVESFSNTDARFESFDDKNGDYSYPISIKVNATDKDKDIQWEFYKENSTLNAGLKDSLYRNANQSYWENHYKDDSIDIDLPLFIYFSDSYPHITSTTGKNIQDMLDSGNPLPRNIAYHKWNDEKNCADIWRQYYTMQWKNDKFGNGKGDKEYLDSINRKMIAFSKSMSEVVNSDDIKIKGLEVESRGKNDVLIICYANGKRIPFTELPQGYNRIFSIVFDIANRSYILNSTCDSTGIVFIDEIELHLHPSITQEILTGITKTFPELQLIVSTHSPLVITNFKQNDKNFLYRLYSENGKYRNERVENLYGLDYNSGLKFSMNTPFRNSEVENLMDAYKYWIREGNESMIKRLKDQIKNIAGEDSETYKSLR